MPREDSNGVYVREACDTRLEDPAAAEKRRLRELLAGWGTAETGEELELVGRRLSGPCAALSLPASLQQPLMRLAQSFALSDPSLPDCPIVYASQGFLALMGYPREQVLGRNCRFLQGPGTCPAELELLREGLAAGRAVTVNLLNYQYDGTPFMNHLHVAQIRNSAGKVTYLVGVQLDVTAPGSDHEPLRGVRASRSIVPLCSATSENVAVVEPTDKAIKAAAAFPSGELVYEPPSGPKRLATSLALLRALPWRRLKKDSVLVIELDGAISEKRQGRFGSAQSVPQICRSLQKAAYDPRVCGILLKISPLSVGWARLQEIREYIAFFRQSGKFSMAFLTTGAEKEYYMASSCEEVYVPPTGNLSLRGLVVAGSFLRDALEKAGVEPQVKRIGKYKSAGDQLLRRDMSEPQHEQLSALLDTIYEGFTTAAAASRGKTVAEVEELLERGVYDMRELADGGWVTALRYEDEVIADLKKRTGGKDDKVRAVGLKKYSSVSPSAFGLVGRKRIAVIRSAGAIVGGAARTGGTITAPELVKKLRQVAEDKRWAGVILRIDSPGGDALASDLIWREIQQLRKKKPVVASMGDVAASGGYYMAMAADVIVAQSLTITGSIGVVLGKFNLQELYRRVGYTKTPISRGRYANLLADQRSFTPEEEALFDATAEFAYRSFRDKAAESRGIAVEAMQDVAQGRVWSGRDAIGAGLVDALGGVARAVAILKDRAGIAPGDQVALVELTREEMSPLTLLTGGATAGAGIPALLQVATEGLAQGDVFRMPDVSVDASTKFF
ncbi:hypothetical protein WJX81_004557 [Elliptochloris bilobata]|uniref:LOV domain-containing protein n=1 Tax=Elliptochloris bilobata TaxID=381761 RepID=A0AAW1SL72_9CHLO